VANFYLVELGSCMERCFTVEVGGVGVSILLDKNFCTFECANFCRTMQCRSTIVGGLIEYPAATVDEILEENGVILQDHFVNHCVALRAKLFID